ncbi:metallophosphoesterase [Streptomyces sp. NPDC058632]|uniref:metallophosphoesterase n=1 Tax=unclassified Streptomyces TaxID=2593676 RepID=UPI0036563547
MSLFAISDLRVRQAGNRDIVEGLRPESDGDWLVVAGDVAEIFDDIVRARGTPSDRFAKVVRTPGNHEPWCGAEVTADWRVRYRATTGVCGHPRVPCTIGCDGVPHREVSLGYPREWRRRPVAPAGLCRTFPGPGRQQ